MAEIEIEEFRALENMLYATPRDSPAYSERLRLLVVLYDMHYGKDLAALDGAIKVMRNAIDASFVDRTDSAAHTSNEISLIPTTLSCLLNERYRQTGEAADLEEAIEGTQNAVNTLPPFYLGPDSYGHLEYVMLLNMLGFLLYERYQAVDTLTDLESAIQLSQMVVSAIHHENQNPSADEQKLRAKRLNVLAIRLHDLYDQTGALTVLNGSIEAARDSTKAIPHDDPSRVRIINDLGCSLLERYKLSGVMSDLEEVIQITKKALDLIPPDDSYRPALLNNLASRIGDRYYRTEVLSDLDQAIALMRTAIDITPCDDLKKASRLNNLGVMLSDRYTRIGATADLENAIEVTREAVNSTTTDHLDCAEWLHNLGARLMDKYQESKLVSDLEEAVKALKEAVEGMPRNHPGRANVLCNLAVGLTERYCEIGSMPDFREATVCCEQALFHTHSTLEDRIEAGKQLILRYVIVKWWPDAYQASQIVVNFISGLRRHSLETSDMQFRLIQVAGVPSIVTAVALQNKKSPVEALNSLESTRGVLATSLEDTRADVSVLQENFPDLAERYLKLCRDLDVSDQSNTTADVDQSWQPDRQDRVAQLSRIDHDLDGTIQEIRNQPGFDTFLLAPSEKEMLAAAEFGPIVVINVCTFRCDAILITSNKIQSIELPDLHRAEIDQKLKRHHLGSPAVLEWLWDAIAKPVLDTLGFTQPLNDDEWPRIWWVPTGPLSRFPIHAAGYHRDDCGDSVLDRVMSSYSPSVKAIVQSRRHRSSNPFSPTSSSSSAPRALLVSMETTPSHFTNLTFAKKELATVRAICDSMNIHSHEPGRTKAEIMTHLPTTKIFHFAGHGYTHNTHPSQSYLALQDWKTDPLTVSNLLDLRLHDSSPFLAYLSACGTGQVKDERLLDESIHLMSACLLAGFRHVVGTLWEVNDEVCVDVARMVYEAIRDGGMEDASVCRGLHGATRELRRRWLAKENSGIRRDGRVSVSIESGIGDGDGADRAGRDIVSCDEDDEGRLLLWVPYVHYGV